MDLAEPAYRGLLVDRSGVVPSPTMNASAADKGIVDFACTNWRLGLKNPNAR
jgi:hypothetical protein